MESTRETPDVSMLLVCCDHNLISEQIYSFITMKLTVLACTSLPAHHRCKYDVFRSLVTPQLSFYVLSLSSGLRPLKDSASAVFEGESFTDLVNLVSCC